MNNVVNDMTLVMVDMKILNLEHFTKKKETRLFLSALIVRVALVRFNATQRKANYKTALDERW